MALGLSQFMVGCCGLGVCFIVTGLCCLGLSGLGFWGSELFVSGLLVSLWVLRWFNLMLLTLL